MKYYMSYHFMMILIFQEKKGHLEGMPKPIKQKLIILSVINSLSVSKNNIKRLFDELLSEKIGFLKGVLNML